MFEYFMISHYNKIQFIIIAKMCYTKLITIHVMTFLYWPSSVVRNIKDNQINHTGRMDILKFVIPEKSHLFRNSRPPAWDPKEPF